MRRTGCGAVCIFESPGQLSYWPYTCLPGSQERPINGAAGIPANLSGHIMFILSSLLGGFFLPILRGSRYCVYLAVGPHRSPATGKRAVLRALLRDWRFLGLFKCLGFFVDSRLFGDDWTLRVILPLGISF